MDESTASLLRRAKQGDDEAFEGLVELYRDRVYGLAFRVVKNRESALDVAQDAFIRIHSELKACRGEEGFEGWLYRLVTNLAIDHYRRTKRRRWLPFLRDFAGGTTPDRALEAAGAKGKLERAMDCLTDRQRKVFVLKHYQGLSTARIAKVMRAAEGTVKATLHQAVNKMREHLKGEQEQ